MAKTPKTLDEENAEKLYGGITKTDLDTAAKKIGELNADKSEILGDLSAAYDAFDKKGGHKQAFKVAMKISEMEEGKAQDFFRALMSYMDAFGCFSQLDLFDSFPVQVGGPIANKAADSSLSSDNLH